MSDLRQASSKAFAVWVRLHNWVILNCTVIPEGCEVTREMMLAELERQGIDVIV